MSEGEELPPAVDENSGERQSLSRRGRPDTLIARLRKNSKRNEVDWWKRASTIASILSSVVIATAGILITWSIQKSQLAVTKAQLQITAAELEVTKQKNEDEKRQEETKLAADLFPQLLDSDPARRTLAVTLLHHRSSTPQAYDDVLAVLATEDKSGSVRKAAIQQLAQSDSKAAGSAVRQIALDTTRPIEERNLALQNDTRFVFQIYAKECESGPETRVQTGFRLEGTLGIITTLHNVIGCQRILARSDVGSDTIPIELSMEKVDLGFDAALLLPRGQKFTTPEGLEQADAIALEGLWMLGHPLGLNLNVSNVTVGLRPNQPLRDLLPAPSLAAISQLGSPSIEAEVIAIDGHVIAGDSGAPLLNKDNKVVGFLDGWIVGSSSLGWAVPIRKIVWKAATAEVLEGIANRQKSSSLF